MPLTVSRNLKTGSRYLRKSVQMNTASWLKIQRSETTVTPRLGIDLGGTKLKGSSSKRTRSWTSCRIPTPKDDYPATINAIIGVISELESRNTIDQPLPVGIGTPGAISHRTGLMKNCNSTCLNGQNLLDDLVQQSGRSVRIANDADCFALSEASDGAGKNGRSVFGVILGTGVGGGLCYEGKLLEGANAICGEWGTQPHRIERTHLNVQ